MVVRPAFVNVSSSRGVSAVVPYTVEPEDTHNNNCKYKVKIFNSQKKSKFVIRQKKQWLANGEDVALMYQIYKNGDEVFFFVV